MLSSGFTIWTSGLASFCDFHNSLLAPAKPATRHDCFWFRGSHAIRDRKEAVLSDANLASHSELSGQGSPTSFARTKPPPSATVGNHFGILTPMSKFHDAIILWEVRAPRIFPRGKRCCRQPGVLCEGGEAFVLRPGLSWEQRSSFAPPHTRTGARHRPLGRHNSTHVAHQTGSGRS